jgi:hypothetical protein
MDLVERSEAPGRRNGRIVGHAGAMPILPKEPAGLTLLKVNSASLEQCHS